jgi:hypothetical protein
MQGVRFEGLCAGSRAKALDCFGARAPRNDGVRFPPSSQRHCERSEAIQEPQNGRSFHPPGSAQRVRLLVGPMTGSSRCQTRNDGGGEADLTWNRRCTSRENAGRPIRIITVGGSGNVTGGTGRRSNNRQDWRAPSARECALMKSMKALRAAGTWRRLG